MTEPTRQGPKIAVALGYDETRQAAPQVIAAGRGDLAEAILKVAQAHGIPLYADHPLAKALVRLEAGAAVPPELYGAVAEVLAFLWRLELERTGGARNDHWNRG